MIYPPSGNEDYFSIHNVESKDFKGQILKTPRVPNPILNVFADEAVETPKRKKKKAKSKEGKLVEQQLKEELIREEKADLDAASNIIRQILKRKILTGIRLPRTCWNRQQV
jgi:hypothetical protein